MGQGKVNVSGQGQSKGQVKGQGHFRDQGQVSRSGVKDRSQCHGLRPEVKAMR